MIFLLKTSLVSFPSDNLLDSMSRRERIAVKKSIRQMAYLEVRGWLRKNKIRRDSLTKTNPLFENPVRTVLKIYVRQSKRIDVHNLSIKHFLDQIVEMHIIADDSIKQVPESVAAVGGFVAKDEFAEFIIEEI